jgi:hypothetical protein
MAMYALMSAGAVDGDAACHARHNAIKPSRAGSLHPPIVSLEVLALAARRSARSARASSRFARIGEDLGEGFRETRPAGLDLGFGERVQLRERRCRRRNCGPSYLGRLAGRFGFGDLIRLVEWRGISVSLEVSGECFRCRLFGVGCLRSAWRSHCKNLPWCRGPGLSRFSLRFWPRPKCPS